MIIKKTIQEKDIFESDFGNPILPEAGKDRRLRRLKKYKLLLISLAILFISSSFFSIYLFINREPENIGLVIPYVSKSESSLSRLADSVLGEASESAEELMLEATPSPKMAGPVLAEKIPAMIKSLEPTAAPAAASSFRPVSSTASVGRINFPNNKFGVYAYAGADQLEIAAGLVNSNGGDWGWVTMPIDINERNQVNWNAIFTKASEKHLIPILQVSNIDKQIPTKAAIDGIAEFLAGLGWPTRIRPITLFNEVNAAEYWGGKVDPEGYAEILNYAVDKFKSLSGEFFMMNGAFNSSAHTICVRTDLGVNTCYLSLDEYMARMNKAVPGIFNKLDGWANHSYPHPGYRGKPTDSNLDQGRLTIQAYRYDLRLLAQYGVSLPVFITETGWPHREGKTEHAEWLDQATVGRYYAAAFTDTWLKDPSIVAVTPFQLKRDDFDNFAFVAADGTHFPQWDSIANITKVKGSPPIN